MEEHRPHSDLEHASTPDVQEFTIGRTSDKVSSVMYCEALAFVAAQLHAAKCVQRYKCSEIAQALNATPRFLFFLFVNSLICLGLLYV